MAHEYGWAKRQILDDIYLDDLVYLMKQINQRKISDYRMQLAIAQNPYTKNPKQLWNILKDQNIEENKNEEFDDVGFERLKNALSENPKFIVK